MIQQSKNKEHQVFNKVTSIFTILLYNNVC